MRRSAFAVSLAFVISFTVFTVPAAAGAGPLRSVIVVLRDDVDSDGIAGEHSQRYGALVSHVYGAVIRGYAARIPERLIAMLQRDSRVAFVEEDRLLWASDTIPRTGVYRIDAEQSPVATSGGSVGTGVAIIDTGISTHPALNIAGGYNCAGFFVNRNAWSDGNGHGTHVAGTVAARNASNIVGAAPGAPLWAVKVLGNNGSGYTSWIICGINWVANNAASKGIKVANMSLGGGGSVTPSDSNCNNSNNDSMHKAICNAVTKKGVTFVAAAGNDAKNFATFVPAAYREVLTVTAMADFDGEPGGQWPDPTCGNIDDTAATFSNWATPGSADEAHTIAAPGVCVTSTYLNNGYATGSGTSFASPHVAGTVALCLADRPGTTPVVRGPCFGMSPSQITAKIRADAKARSESDPSGASYYGFTNDPNKSPITGRYYGHLVYAGNY